VLESIDDHSVSLPSATGAEEDRPGLVPDIRYARTTDGVHIAYQVTGDGPTDVLMVASRRSTGRSAASP